MIVGHWPSAYCLTHHWKCFSYRMRLWPQSLELRTAIAQVTYWWFPFVFGTLEFTLSRVVLTKLFITIYDQRVKKQH